LGQYDGVRVYSPDPWQLERAHDVTAPLFLLFKYKYIPVLKIFLCPSVGAEATWIAPDAGSPEAIRQNYRNFCWAKPRCTMLCYTYANPYPMRDPNGFAPGGEGP